MSEVLSPLQQALRNAIDSAPEARDHYDRKYQQRTGKTGKPIYDIMRGGSLRPKIETLRVIAGLLGKPDDFFVEIAYPRTPQARTKAAAARAEDDDVAMVGIQHVDQSYGLGRTFTDNPVEVDVLQFPKVWIDSITSTPPELLTWTRGRGDSMEPTIHDGDLVLLDRSQRKIGEPDALWAFAAGNTGGIKRLRIKGDRVIILSDNPSVPEDWEPADAVSIVARVIFVGKRK